MFKNLTLYKLVLPAASPFALEAAARAAQFTPCGPTQALSAGFAPPREKNGALVETVGDALILAALVEVKTVPTAEITKWVDAAASRLENDTGRKPGKKARADLKEQVLLDLLPKAFPKQVQVLVWIDRRNARVLLDTSSPAKADVVTALLASHLGLALSVPEMQVSPAAMMKTWVSSVQGLGAFDLGQECELRDEGTKATVRYSNTPVDAPDVRAHVTAGKSVRKLGLEWTNGTVADFVLSDDLTLTKIELAVPPADGNPTDAFDADVALTTGALMPMLTDLITALGGEKAP